MYEELINELKLTKAEKAFIDDLPNDVTKSSHKRTIFLSNVYLAKKFEILTDKLISSNEILSRSQQKYSKAMAFLTGALVFFGLAQLLIAILNLLKNIFIRLI